MKSLHIDMKRRLIILTAVLFAVGVLLCGGAAAAEGRKLTVMVYMCGSNLESEYGSATTDILEMSSAGFSPGDTAVLVMMGGSDSWDLSPGLEGTVIMEIGPGRQKTVWRSEQLNMGNEETLTQLLDFGHEKYPAEDYALILWDHGGGPLEGVCWDELFSMDHLTLEELSEGIRRAWLPGKLSWIGFDACLMGSAEVAAAMAPYAEYMIASEETEPAAGWNYAFLKDASGDGAATGRRIIDCYFDDLASSRDPLTMACIDLSAISRLTEAMEAFFPAIDARIDPEHFADLSRIRSAASGFGKGVRAVGVEGYDLVDLADLTAQYGGTDSELGEALKEAVVYVRSADGKAGGLSVYHPYANKQKYLESWRNSYRRLDFSAAYTRYLEHFGAILTSEEYVDWSGMTAEDLGTTEDGSCHFRLQLTEAQAKEFLSAELMIMARNAFSSRDHLSLAPVAVVPVSPDKAGGLTAAYRGTSLYAVNAEGEVLAGPISFQMTEDGEYFLILAVYQDYSSGADTKDQTAVLHYCKPNETTGELEIVRNYVYDRVSQTYTNRIPFSEKGFTDVEFRYFIRDLPDPGKAMPAFEEWKHSGGYYARVLSLPCDWHLRFVDEWNTDELYAVFQVTDIRQNRWSAVPLTISHPLVKEMAVKESHPESEDFEIQASAALWETKQYPSLDIRIQVTNRSGQSLRFQGSDLILNGFRNAGNAVYISGVEPEKTEEDTITLNQTALTGLSRISSVDFTLSVSVEGDYQTPPTVVPVHLELENGDLGILASETPDPLDTVQDGDTVWQLISLRQETDGSLSGLLHVRHDGDADLKTGGMLLINGMQTGNELSVRLSPGTDAYIPFRADNCATVSYYSLQIAGTNRLYLLGVNQALEQAGITVADRVDFYPGMDYYSEEDADSIITLRMPEGVALQPGEPMPEPVLLLDDGGIRAGMESLLIADNGIGIGLRLENDTDETVRLQIIAPVLNEKTYKSFEPTAGVRMPPHTRAVYCLVLRDRDGFKAGTPAEEMTFRFRMENRVSEPVRIRFPEGTVLGKEGGTLLSAGETAVTAAVIKDKPMVLNETIAVSDADFRPIRLTAPLTPEEADLLDSGNVSLCLISHEKSPKGDAPEQIATRTILQANLQQTGTDWTAELSGLAVTVQGHPLRTVETRLAKNSWQLRPDSVYFYPEAGTCQPSGGGLLFDPGDFLYSDVTLTVENTAGRVLVSDSRMKLSSWSLFNDDRTNRYLEEIAEAAMENRVYFGTDRMENYQTVDYSEAHMLSTEASLTLTLVPVQAVEGPKCLYYVFFFRDGSRKDIILDPESGEVLDQTVIR